MVQRSVTFPRILFLAGFNGLFLCVVLVFSKSFTISDEEVGMLGNPHPFYESAEIAAQLGVPLLIRSHVRPDNPQPYERIEQFSTNTDYDYLDGVLWNVLALFSDIRPTAKVILQRNYIFYLLSIWLYSLALAWHHKNWLIAPAVFASCSLLVFLPQVQTLFRACYVVQGMVTVAPIFMAVYILVICDLFSVANRHLRYWLPAILIYSFFLRYISVIHSANQSSMLIMLIISLPLIYMRFRPLKRVALGIFCFSILGVILFEVFVAGLKEYRDQAMQFTHPKPEHTDHTTFSIIYLGIGSFENSIGLTTSDDYMWHKGLIEKKAEELGVTITPEESAIIGGAPKAEALYFRLWTAYIAQHPIEYLKNRIQANAWIIARFALRGVYPQMSHAEQVFWCIVAVLSWGAIGWVLWSFLYLRPPIEAIVILLASYVPMALMGILHHPVRGVFSGMPVLLAAITMGMLLLFRILRLPSLKRSV